jgi:hypothetical protein
VRSAKYEELESELIYVESLVIEGQVQNRSARDRYSSSRGGGHGLGLVQEEETVEFGPCWICTLSPIAHGRTAERGLGALEAFFGGGHRHDKPVDVGTI